MKKITVLSGKGGVGKSSISASLALAFSKDNKVICADCDVDASNLSLVFGAEKHNEWDDLSTNEKAVFDMKKCVSCRRCFNECQFDAIGFKNGIPFLKDFSCEGCGVCRIVCPAGAVSMKKINNAKIGYSRTKYGFDVVSAQLNAGESGSGKVVFEVRKKADKLGRSCDYMIIDSAAGIGCPVIASVVGSDHAVLVTEPTPSGLSDMKKALKVLRNFNIPCSIIINKFDINKDNLCKVRDFAGENKINIIAEIPFDRKFAEALTNMVPVIEYAQDYNYLFEKIKKSLIGFL